MKKIMTFNLFVLTFCPLFSTDGFAQDTPQESWVFIWASAEVDSEKTILFTEIVKESPQQLGDQHLAESFKNYYHKKGIDDIGEPAIISSDTKEEAEKDREVLIDTYHFDEEISLAEGFSFDTPEEGDQ